MNDAGSVLFSGSSLYSHSTRLSVKRNGKAVQDAVNGPSISDDARRVVASNEGYELMEGTDGAYRNALLFDCDKGNLSLLPDAAAARNDSTMGCISGDGRHAAYCASSPQTSRKWTPQERANTYNDDCDQIGVFVRDLDTGETQLCSNPAAGPPIGHARDPVLSRDSSMVVFTSSASNLVDGDTNGCDDVFAFDRQRKAQTCVSVGSDGRPANGPSINGRVSADGHVVAFASAATNLVDGDINGAPDIFLRDLQQGKTTRVSVTRDGQQADGPSFAPALAASGRWVAFATWAPNLGAHDVVDRQGFSHRSAALCVYDTQSARTETLALPADLQLDRVEPSISSDGRFIAFVGSPADATDISPRSNVFVYDRTTAHTACISRNKDEQMSDRDCGHPVITPDGQHIAYTSDAANLVDLPVYRYHPQLYLAANPMHEATIAQVVAEKTAVRKTGTIEDGDTFVVIDGVRIPKRRPEQTFELKK